MQKDEKYREFLDSPVGKIVILANETAVTGVYFYDAVKEAETDGSAAGGTGACPNSVTALAAREITEYLEGKRKEFDIPVEEHGTPFQERVWAELSRIPYGETVSYGELAERIGAPGASRACGSANGKNPVSIIVPCHRVIKADGTAGGYGGGPERKKFLLELERSHV